MCFKSISKILLGVSRKFQGVKGEVSRNFLECFKVIFFCNLLLHVSHHSYQSRTMAYLLFKMIDSMVLHL